MQLAGSRSQTIDNYVGLGMRLVIPAPPSQKQIKMSSVSEAPADESVSESAPLVPQQRQTCGRVSKLLKATKKWLVTNVLLLLTIASVLIGCAVGLSVKEAHPDRVAVVLIAFPGEIFLRMLKMLILPLIIFSLIAGLGSLEVRVAGALGWKTMLYYGTTTVLAVALGLLLVMTIQPGSRHQIEVGCDNSTTAIASNSLETLDAILDLLRNIFPDNLFEATFSQAQTYYSYEMITNYEKCVNETYNITDYNCSFIQSLIVDLNLDCVNATETNRHITLGTREGMNVLGIIVFSVSFAVVLSRMGTEGQRIVGVISTLNEVIMKLVTLVMWYSPIGIASIIAGKLLEVESFAMLVEEIGLYFVTVLVGLVVHGCIVLPLIYLFLTRQNPLKMVRAALQALLTAFGTSSSSATLPVTIQCLEQNFAADPRVTRFMLPVGATINMDGTALYEAVAAVFIAQLNGLNASIPDIIIISITATAASIGAAGVPQAGLFTLVIVLIAVGLPPEDAAIIVTVDWLLDRFRTTVNVLGDCFGVGIVQHYSRKDLKKTANNGAPPIPTNPQPVSMAPNMDSAPSITNDSLPRNSSNDYGISHSPPPPPPTPHTPPTPQWSVSTRSLDSAEKPQVFMSGMGSSVEIEEELPATKTWDENEEISSAL